LEKRKERFLSGRETREKSKGYTIAIVLRDDTSEKKKEAKQ
jgi:hypothetical protein